MVVANDMGQESPVLTEGGNCVTSSANRQDVLSKGEALASNTKTEEVPVLSKGETCCKGTVEPSIKAYKKPVRKNRTGLTEKSDRKLRSKDTPVQTKDPVPSSIDPLVTYCSDDLKKAQTKDKDIGGTLEEHPFRKPK